MTEELYNVQMEYILHSYEHLFLEMSIALKWKLLAATEG